MELMREFSIELSDKDKKAMVKVRDMFELICLEAEHSCYKCPLKENTSSFIDKCPKILDTLFQAVDTSYDK